MARKIADEILEGLHEAADYLDGKPTKFRTTSLIVPKNIDAKAVREAVGLTQAEFSERFAIPIDTVRKWERVA